MMKLGMLVEKTLDKKEPKMYKTTKNKKYPDQLQAQPIKNRQTDWSPEGEEPHHAEFMELEGKDSSIHYMFVDGPFVRDNYHIDYVEGGHFYRYAFIPEDEIWIEDGMSRIDTIAVGLHETHERYLMKYKGWRYEDAHESASDTERKFRDLIKKKGTFIPDYENIKAMYQAELKGKTNLYVGVEGKKGRIDKSKVIKVEGNKKDFSEKGLSKAETDQKYVDSN
jgi:hypothetical protein